MYITKLRALSGSERRKLVKHVKGDRYTKAIAFLRKYPRFIYEAWNYPNTFPGDLFRYMGDSGDFGGFGCLTQVKSGSSGAATSELTKRILNDQRIPDNPKNVRVKDLPVFAEYQRYVDRHKLRHKS